MTSLREKFNLESTNFWKRNREKKVIREWVLSLQKKQRNSKSKSSKYEVDKIMKQYKKIKRKEKSNISQVKKLGLVINMGGHSMDRDKLKVMIKDLKNVVKCVRIRNIL